MTQPKRADKGRFQGDVEMIDTVIPDFGGSGRACCQRCALAISLAALVPRLDASLAADRDYGNTLEFSPERP